MRAGVAIVALSMLLAGCGLFADADAGDEPVDPGGLGAGDEPPSALVSRPVPASQLGADAVTVSDVERIEQLRGSLEAEQRDDDTLVSLPGDVLFAFDRAAVTEAGRRTLADVAELVELEDPPEVRVEGHTDSVGDPAYNQELSQRRAQAVAAVLTDEHGIDAALLAVRGFGEEQPVAANTTDDGKDDPRARARNRRVEVILVDR